MHLFPFPKHVFDACNYSNKIDWYKTPVFKPVITNKVIKIKLEAMKSKVSPVL